MPNTVASYAYLPSIFGFKVDDRRGNAFWGSWSPALLPGVFHLAMCYNYHSVQLLHPLLRNYGWKWSFPFLPQLQVGFLLETCRLIKTLVEIYRAWGWIEL